MTPAALAANDYNSQSRFPISLAMTNECNGELVNFSGELHVSSHRHDNKDGSTTYSVEINYANAKGIGETTGSTYMFGSNSQSITTYPSGSTTAYVYSQKQTIRLVSRGSDPDMHITFLLDYSYDGTDFVTSLYDFRMSCSGK